MKHAVAAPGMAATRTDSPRRTSGPVQVVRTLDSLDTLLKPLEHLDVFLYNFADPLEP